MSCKNTYNFCTTTKHTVNNKEFHINEADGSWDLKLEIFNRNKVLLETVSLSRVDDKTWRWDEYMEQKPQGEYSYTLCYIKGGKERIILKGKINVENYR